MKTIRKRIVAIAAICALIMGLSLGGLSYYYSGHMATEDSETLMLAKSEETKAKLDSILSGIQQSVETLTEIAVSELDDFDSFKTSSKYVENYTKKIENTVLHFAENTWSRSMRNMVILRETPLQVFLFVKIHLTL